MGVEFNFKKRFDLFEGSYSKTIFRYGLRTSNSMILKGACLYPIASIAHTLCRPSRSRQGSPAGFLPRSKIPGLEISAEWIPCPPQQRQHSRFSVAGLYISHRQIWLKLMVSIGASADISMILPTNLRSKASTRQSSENDRCIVSDYISYRLLSRYQ